MLPATGVYRRLTQLNSVVLPAPLGPIRPHTLPTGTENEGPSSAVDTAEAHGDVRHAQDSLGGAGGARVLDVSAS